MMNQKPNFLQAVIAVLWAFIGIRKGKSSLSDQGVKPIHILFAGVLSTLLFVAILITIVRLILNFAA